jgi:phosphopantetheine adenylyltransferase
MIIEHVCFYPGDFAPPTRFHMDTLFWLMTRNEVGHVNIVIGKDPSNNITQDQKAKLWELLLKSSMAALSES